MKKYLLHIFSFLSLIAVGCTENYNQLTTGYGDLEIDITVDTTITNIAEARNLEIPAPDINSIKISAQGENGTRREWMNIDEFEKSHKMIPVDSYTFIASSGNSAEEGYIQPRFYAEQKAAVHDNSLTSIDLTCKISSTLVSLDTENFHSTEVKDLSVRVKSENGKYITLHNGCSEYALVNPGKIKGELTVTGNSGQTVTLQPIIIDNAAPARHYEIRVKTPDDGSGAINLIYDNSTLKEPIQIPVGDELFSTEPPSFQMEGVNGSTMQIFEKEGISSPVKCKVKIPGGLKHLFINTNTEAANDDNQLNKETELVGYNTTGGIYDMLSISGNEEGSEQAEIDLTDLISNLTAENGENTAYSITLQAHDTQGRVSNYPCYLIVNVIPINISILQPEEMAFGAKNATLKIRYNGNDFRNSVKLQYEKNGDEWEELEITGIATGERGVFDVTAAIPDDLCSLNIRAEYKGGLAYSQPVTLLRQIPEFGAVCNRENIWPSKADIIITGDYAEEVIKFLSVYIKESDGDMHPAVVERVPEERRITISTLMPSTDYSIIVSTSSANEKHIGITTEEAIELPNGSFEDNIKETISIPLINCGGKYSNLNSWMPTYNTTSIKVTEAEDWASVNAKTCSGYAKTANTWFKVPTTEIIKSSYDGQYAVLLRNAAWDINGTEPPRDTRTDEIYYSSNVPYISNRSAGKIFLGTYSFDQSGNETYDEGINFTSRPTSITGYYYYRQDVNDLQETGIAVIKLINESDGTATVIGEGRGELKASTSFTRFTVPISYNVRNKQATKLQLMISSSCYASYSQADETRKIKTTDYPEKGVSTGAELVVDNLQLLYE